MADTDHGDAPHETEEVTPPNIEVSAMDNHVRNAIVHVLGIYPKLNPSMLQMGIGPSIPTIIWKPVMRRMIAEGILRETMVQATAPSGRTRAYSIISLASTPV